MEDMFERVKSDYKELLTDLKAHKIPKEYPNTVIRNLGVDTFVLRSLVIREQGFALVANNWVSRLAKWINGRKCVELMAGCGSLSYALQQNGVDIIATDNFSWETNEAVYENWTVNKNYWLDIENIDCIEAIEKYKDADIFIISWAYMDDTAYRALLKMREVNPSAFMIFIGEGCGGCTANDDFYNSIIEVDDMAIHMINAIYPRWNGIHDRLFLVV